MAYRDPVLEELFLGEPEDDDYTPPPKRENESPVSKSFFGFMKNLGNDIKDFGMGITAPLHSYGQFEKGISDIIFNEQGERSLDGLKAMGGAFVDRAEEIISEPWESFYERPLSTGLDVVGTVAPPLRAGGAAARGVGATKTGEVLRQTANAVEAFDPMSWPSTFAAGANRLGTQTGLTDDSVKLTEGVVKPKLAPRHKQSDSEYRQRVITSALERGIDPSEAGMKKLQEQLDATMGQINRVMAKAGDRQINTTELVNGWKSYANEHFDRTHPEWERMVNAVDAQEKKIRRQYKNHPDGEIVSINSEGLRKARIGADTKVDHNARNLESDSVQAEIDRLYSHYLREQLGEAVPEIKALNAEASALFDIYDMYQPAVMRMNNRMPISLQATQSLVGTGLASALAGNVSDNLPLTVAGAAVAGLPMAANAVPTRLSRARSNFNSSRAGFGDALTGALLRDRNNAWGYGRKGANFTEALISELMGEEEQY